MSQRYSRRLPSSRLPGRLRGTSNHPAREHLLPRDHQSPRGNVELLESQGNYRPPSSLMQNSNTETNLYDQEENDICYPIPQHHRTSMLSLRIQNPAKDLAIPLFSHGCCCCQCVRTQQVGFTEQCGRFEQILGPGFYCMPWPVNSISGRLSLRIQQLDVVCETKTSDNVFCEIKVAILYRVNALRCYDAYYRLVNPHIQIQACVLDVVRSSVPSSMTLDHLFENKRELADRVFTQLQGDIGNYGYEVVQTLVTKVAPNGRVKASMNEMNASRRLKQAAPHKAEAHKTELVNKAQAQAEGDYLRGVGIARERQEIVNGMKECVNMWIDVDVRVTNPPSQKEVMDLLLISHILIC